jgi:hypothetical protein
MSQSQILEFDLHGTVAGKPISAANGMPFSKFAEFNEEVQKYVLGSDRKTVLNDLQVQVAEGSYLLRVILPVGILTSLITDTAKLANSASMADIDPERSEIILRWQERAKMNPSLLYKVQDPNGAFAPVVVNARSSFAREGKTTWIQVERYLIGEITDWGGAQSVNLHLRVRNSRETIIIKATADQIREQEKNLVFHKALVHVHAKQNPKTGELKDYTLVDLRAYAPNVSEVRLQELFDKGAKAWADISNASEWVRELRGGTHV